MPEMTIRTGQSISGPASTVWSLLCNSRMDDTTTLLFRLGVPHPVRCRVPDGHGGVGSERECESDRGIVHQRILEWEPEKRLTIRMERTDLGIQKYVREMVETFDLVGISGGVRVTRTTRVWTHGRFRTLKKMVLVLRSQAGSLVRLSKLAKIGRSGEPRLPDARDGVADEPRRVRAHRAKIGGAGAPRIFDEFQRSVRGHSPQELPSAPQVQKLRLKNVQGEGIATCGFM